MVHTNVPHKNQMYFYTANGFHKKDFSDLKPSIFMIRFIRDRGT